MNVILREHDLNTFSGMEEYLRIQTKLISLERDEDKRQFESNSHESLKILELNGFACRKLVAESKRTTNFNKLLISFKYSTETARLQNGDIVGIEKGNSRSQVCSGTIFRQNVNGVQVAIDGDDASEVDTDSNVPSYHLVKLANDITYQRYEKTVRLLGENDRKFNQSPLFEIFDKMFGKYW